MYRRPDGRAITKVQVRTAVAAILATIGIPLEISGIAILATISAV